MHLRDLVCGVAIAMTLCGCSHEMSNFTFMYGSNYPGSGVGEQELSAATTRVKGSSTAHNIWGIPVGTPDPQKAIDNALAKYPGAIGLTNGVMKANYWWAILYGQHKITVEGSPLYPSSQGGYQRPQSSVPYVQPTTPVYAQPAVPVYEQPAQPVAPAAPVTNDFVHEVKAGDTLAGIAKQYGVSLADVIRWNRLSSNTLTPGQRLTIKFENK